MYQGAVIPKHQCIKGVCSLAHSGMRKIRMMEWDSYKAKLIPFKGKLLLTFLLKLSDGFQRHFQTRLPPWLRSVLQAQLLSYLTRPASLATSLFRKYTKPFASSGPLHLPFVFPGKLLSWFFTRLATFHSNLSSSAPSLERDLSWPSPLLFIKLLCVFLKEIFKHLVC